MRRQRRVDFLIGPLSAGWQLSELLLPIRSGFLLLRRFPATHTVLASEDRSFDDLDGRSFVWLCDLRDSVVR